MAYPAPHNAFTKIGLTSHIDPLYGTLYQGWTYSCITLVHEGISCTGSKSHPTSLPSNFFMLTAKTIAGGGGATQLILFEDQQPPVICSNQSNTAIEASCLHSCLQHAELCRLVAAAGSELTQAWRVPC